MPWAKGESGNPRGSPKKALALAPTLRGILRELDPVTGESYRRCVALALVRAAAAGNVEAIKVVFDRVDGPLRVPLEHTGRDGAPIGLAFDHAAILAELVAPALALGPGDDREPPGPPQGAGDGSSVGEDRDGG